MKRFITIINESIDEDIKLDPYTQALKLSQHVSSKLGRSTSIHHSGIKKGVRTFSLNRSNVSDEAADKYANSFKHIQVAPSRYIHTDEHMDAAIGALKEHPWVINAERNPTDKGRIDITTNLRKPTSIPSSSTMLKSQHKENIPANDTPKLQITRGSTVDWMGNATEHAVKEISVGNHVVVRQMRGENLDKTKSGSETLYMIHHIHSPVSDGHSTIELTGQNPKTGHVNYWWRPSAINPRRPFMKSSLSGKTDIQGDVNSLLGGEQGAWPAEDSVPIKQYKHRVDLVPVSDKTMPPISTHVYSAKPIHAKHAHLFLGHPTLNNAHYGHPTEWLDGDKDRFQHIKHGKRDKYVRIDLDSNARNIRSKKTYSKQND